MDSVTSYRITVAAAPYDRLQKKLGLADFPTELEDAEWDYGTPLADVKRLANYWRNGFNWLRQVDELNQLPNFQTHIQADGFEPLRIHFVHQKSAVAAAIPLLFVHGWPGSFIEVVKLLPLLTKGGTDTPVFHVVAPSLPNFGFSEGTKKRGFSLKQYAETCHKLMLRLGYDQYVTQGGDWGSHITRSIGAAYPRHCKGSHINYMRAMAPTFFSSPLLALQHAVTPYSQGNKEGLVKTQLFTETGTGYNLLQSTKPQTIGYALQDSPVALLSWIYEKLHGWVDNYPWTDDEILTWVSIYWFSTAGPAASVRIYYEVKHSSEEERSVVTRYLPHVKLGIAYFPKEICLLPKSWGRTLGPVVLQSDHATGGHFAAHERPDAIAQDLRTMFGKGGGAFGVVEGKSGYD